MKEEFWLRQERAKSLAIVYLTRRNDLSVETNFKTDAGVDVLAQLAAGGVFGVQAQGLLSPRQVQRATKPGAFRLNVRPETSVNADFSYPLCQFVFIMQTDEGYYRWLRQPVTQAGGNGYLLTNESESETFRKLDNQALADIVAEVGQWYGSRIRISA